MYESLPSPSLHNKGLHASWKATNRINPTSDDSFVGTGPTESSAISAVRIPFNLGGGWGAAHRGSPPYPAASVEAAHGLTGGIRAAGQPGVQLAY